MAEDAPSSTRKIIVIVVGVVIAVVVALGGIGVVTGVLLRGETSAHPPCDQLPAVTEVEDALAAHPSLVQELEHLGDNVQVTVGEPCGTGTDQALVQVTYAEKSERDAIDSTLGQREGFGVPVYVVKN